MKVTISNHSLLKKIEEEVLKAKQLHDSNKQKQHVYTIKTLCELILEQGAETAADISHHVNPAPITTLTYEKSQPLKTDDGSNGDSIFDF